MTVVLTHLFKLLSFFPLIFAVFLLDCRYLITSKIVRQCFWKAHEVQYMLYYTKFCQNPIIFSQRYGNLTIFKMAAVHHLGFLICSFCHVAFVGMPFCFLVQNFAEIGQSVNELWPKKRFSRWRPSPSRILKISISGHVTVIGFNIWCSVENFIKIGRFFTEIMAI